MIVWAVASIMSLLCAGVVLFVFLRKRGPADDTAAYDIEVYKDQLTQVGDEFDRGLLTAEEAATAKTEISRRLLAADTSRQAAPSSKHSAPGLVTAVALGVLIPAFSLSMYFWRGSPDLPGQPFAERMEGRASQTAQKDGATSLEAAAAKLRARLETEQDDVDGWGLLAQTYMNLQRYADAAKSYERVLGLKNDDPKIHSALGEALTLAAQGSVTPKARAAFEETTRLDAGNPRARFYLAMADFQAGKKQSALDKWAALMKDSPADAPWVPAVRGQIEQTANDLGLDVAAVTPQPRPAQRQVSQAPDSQPNGPTPEQMRAAQNMSPEERNEMIRGMVSGLAAKLDENPMNFDGWMRLIRSYATLGETEKAGQALNKALDVFAKAPFPKQRLQQLAAELNLTGSAAAAESAPRGPTAEQMRDAQNMSAEDRQAMIEGMVNSLAERLEENPKDIGGWIRLARSYNVLGKPEKAHDALRRAIDVAPDNVDLLTLFARAERAANGNAETEASLDAMQRILVLAPNNIEALWFVGGAKAQAGDPGTAKLLWERAINSLPEGSPDRAEFEKRIQTLP